MTSTVVIQPLLFFDATRFSEIASGYVSAQRYVVRKEETEAQTTFSLVLEDLETPYVKRWNPDSSDDAMYRAIVAEQKMSLGVYEGDRLIGIAIAERRDWNRSLHIHEFHVDEDCRGRGIGRRLMEDMVEMACEAGLSMLCCETQNTNVPAVRFYRRVGFELDGIDLSFYPAEIDEVAFFMKRRLGMSGDRSQSCSSKG